MDYAVAMPLAELCFPGLLCFIFLASFIFTGRTFSDYIQRLSLAAITSGCICLLSDSVNYYFLDLGSHNTLRLFMLALSFTSKISCSSFCVSLSVRNSKKGKYALFPLILVNAVLSFVSIPTGCVFFINSDLSVGHGFLYFVPYLIITYNCIILMVTGFKQIRTNPGETVIILAMVFFPSVATYLEVMLHMRLVLPLSFMICVVFYYMILNVQMYRRDTLTQILNRRSFYMDAKRHYHRKMYVVSMDLNNLKYYNDTFGHAAGDKAILTAVSCMQKAFSRYGVVYRTGGDEFMALFVNKRKQTVVACLKDFVSLLDETEYQVAWGVSLYHPGDDFDEIVGFSDAKMYRTKQAMKKARIQKALKKHPEI